jgi:Tfp pilus assembly protein PilZ
MTQYFERRSDIRTNYKSPATVEDSKGIIYRARIVNYSNNGLYIETDWPLYVGTEIYIEMEKSPYASSAFEFLDRRQSVILWHTELNDSFYSYGYGIKYINDFEEKTLQISVLNKTKKAVEMRRFPRKHYSNSVYFTAQNNYFEGLIHNISKNGMFIETKDNFNEGQIVRLVIPGTKIDNGTMLKGEIKHLSRKGIGVQFKRILKTQIKKIQIKNRSSYIKRKQNYKLS